jgi:hypothetical protein
MMEASPGKKEKMTCAEFQAVLPYIIDSGGNADEQEHLRGCALCSGLVADLKYIADQAKLLVPMVEPGNKVWDGIKSSLEREGIVKDRARGRLLNPFPRTRWGPATWMLPVAALVVVSVGLFLYRNNAGADNATAAEKPTTTAYPNLATDSADPALINDNQEQQVLSQLGEQAPSLRQTYEQELRDVNSYISDARTSVQRDPDDEEARQALMEAYDQKVMVYAMAMQHSLR